MRVDVVTDSTCDLPRDLTDDLGVRVVPLTVSFDATGSASRPSLGDAEFYRLLSESDELPTTSQPAAPSFEEAWRDAADGGADAIVSLHVSAALSGTVERARSVAAAAPVPVQVVDSRQVSGGLALQVLAAARVAAAGGTADEVAAVAAAVSGATTSLLAVDSLSYLRRGGRLTGAQAVLGTALRVRPVLGIRDGAIVQVGRARTWRGAVRELVDAIDGVAGDHPQHVAVAHALDEERAGALLDELHRRVPIEEEHVVVIGPVVGTHVGPGAVGVATVPAAAAGGA